MGTAETGISRGRSMGSRFSRVISAGLLGGVNEYWSISG